jgi:hypothetical protein
MVQVRPINLTFFDSDLEYSYFCHVRRNNTLLERQACKPVRVRTEDFNHDAVIPFGCTITHLESAMNDFVDFIAFINTQLNKRQLARLETMLMPANFSSMVGEFMAAAIPKYCSTIVKNKYHNGHPDLIPAGMFTGDAVQHSHIGIEIKSSRYPSGWQGHNAENIWLMVFVFESDRPADRAEESPPKPFKFVKVVGAELSLDDWQFSGRSETSRRTITASVKPSGYQKMESNWLYRMPRQKLLEA